MSNETDSVNRGRALLYRLYGPQRAAQKQSGISGAASHIIWALALLLIIIFVALYLDIRTNNETIIRTNLMKNTARVTDNIELRLTTISSSLGRAVEKLENHQATTESFDAYAKNFFDLNPEVVLMRLIEKDGKGLQTAFNTRFQKKNQRVFSYIDYPPQYREAINEAFRTNRVTYSDYVKTSDDLGSPSVIIVYPFVYQSEPTAFMVRISLTKLLNESVPSFLHQDYEFSFIHGTERIAGRAAYSDPAEMVIPSYVRSAEPLPPAIQLFGCSIIETPLIFASPLLFWLGALILLLLALLFVVNRKIKDIQQKFETQYHEVSLRRSIEDSAQFGILITDFTNTIIYANQPIYELTGYSPDELVGKETPLPFWNDPKPLPGTVIPPNSIRRDEFPLRMDVSLRKKTTQRIQALMTTSPFLSANKEHVGWLYVFNDNTVDYKSQTLTNDAIESYQKLLDSVSSCISMVTHKPSGSIMGIRNVLYEEQLGYTVEGHQLISKALTTPFDAQGKRHEELYVKELSRWFNVTEARVTLPGGSHVTLQTARDITAQKNNEKLLEEQNNKMETSSRLITLGEMASTITHEINQPLTAILAYSNTALEIMTNMPELNKNQVLEVFTKIATQAGRIDKIIKNIRSFSKRRTTTMEATPIANIISDTTELGKLVEKKYHGVKIVYESPRTEVKVHCDPIQVVQVLMNLIRNAAEAVIEAESKDMTIRVKAEIRGDLVKISVSDCGPGINETMKASLFTPFFSTKKTGLGLGLSTCQTIAEAHNTKLCVEDTPCGGTTFSFELKIIN